MAFTMKRLTEFTFDETVNLWNRGFEEYMVDISMPLDRLIGRFGLEGLSPAVSVVACDGDVPVGFVMNGIRTIGGRKVSWNGGTGVIPEYRRRGVGKLLIQASLDVYRENGVQLATLEAIDSNAKAIPLYEQMGYQTIRKVAFFHLPGAYDATSFSVPADFRYNMKQGIPRDAGALSFHNAGVPWQSQWQNARDGEAVVAHDANGQAAGYAIFKRAFDDDNALTGVTLFQCEVAPGRPDGEAVTRALLGFVYGSPDVVCRRATVNVELTNETLVSVLCDAGFTVMTEQVYMERPMEGR